MARLYEKMFGACAGVEDDVLNLELNTSSEVWAQDLYNTKADERRDSLKESPSVFFEGAVISIPLSLVFWALIYVAIRGIFL